MSGATTSPSDRAKGPQSGPFASSRDHFCGITRYRPVMEMLSDGDIRLMLGFLHEASEVDGPDVFTEAVVDALWHLIPADAGAACNTMRGVDPGVRPETRTMLSFSEIGSEWCVNLQTEWTDELEEICRAYIEQDPIPPVPKFVNRPVRQSDVISRRELHRSELWQYLSPFDGVEDSLRLWLAVPGEEGLRRFEFNSGRWGGMSDRDVHVLELLEPHLVRLYARAAARRATSPMLAGLTPREREVIGLVARGKTNREIAGSLWISPGTVRTHLEHIFEKLGVTNRTAAAARAFGAASET